LRKGSHHSFESIEKNRIANSGINNPMWGKVNASCPNWKGDKACRVAIHQWIKRRKPKPKLCEYCNENEAKDLANLSGKYLRDVTDFMWLCRKCHLRLDGRQIYMYRFKDSYVRKGEKTYGDNWSKQRQATLKRDNYCCRVCGLSQDKLKSSLIVHHRFSVKDGGTNDLDNLICVCHSCHASIEPKLKKKIPVESDELRDVA